MNKVETQPLNHTVQSKIFFPGVRGQRGFRERRNISGLLNSLSKSNIYHVSTQQWKKKKISLDLHHETKTSRSKNCGLKTFE